MNAAVLHQALHLISPFYIVAGTLAGYLVGIIPGLGPAAGITLLLPLTYYMSPAEALIFYASLYQSAEYSGSITAIAVSTPGTPNAAATVLDGFAMNRDGKIGKAFAYSLWSAAFASLVGTCGMLLLAEPMARLALYFGPSEYAALGIFGLSSVSILSSEYPLRGLLSAVLGLLLSTVGLDLISGTQRFTFGIPSLFDGLPLVALLTGLFALPEAVVLLTEKQAGFQLDSRRGSQAVWLRWREFAAVFPPMLLGTAVGFIMGLVPGLAGSVPPWISYNLARLTSRERERFGKGAPAGIVAPEATNAAVMHSTLLPAFSFGIPGTPTSAVILGAMMLSGLTPGPMLFAEHAEIPYAVFISLFLATVFLWVVGLVATNVWVRILTVPPELLAIGVILFVVIGSYVARTNLFDPQLAVIAGIIGYVMKKSHFSAPALVVGFILGPIIETNVRRALLLSGGTAGFGMPGPLTAVLLVLSVVMLGYGIRQNRGR
ncbi:MAG TPA: tripartite tricarboxylate transporter permease [Stellaceae bacterium]|jgi:putative tricarboxylic transport membrane protein|nr:tripartite tricarboxylate transporter permease [Stellaceae bacterium]